MALDYTQSMDLLHSVINLFLHLDKNLTAIIQQYGVWTYALLFLIIFLETGLVVTPFLPGDSLLFVAGTFASTDALAIDWLILILCLGAILGDTVNYYIGHLLGPRVFAKEQSRFFNKEYLEKTREYFDKYGSKTIILARFIPVIRTFAPFVAGVGAMRYGQFICYNIIGGVMWVSLFTLGGYFFGNLSFIKEHFHTVVLAIIVISIVPAVVEFLRHRAGKKKEAATSYSEISKTFQKQHLTE